MNFEIFIYIVSHLNFIYITPEKKGVDYFPHWIKKGTDTMAI